MIAPPSSSATRRVSASWQTTAPAPAHTGATEATASARSSEPPSGSPARIDPRAVASHSTRTPAPMAVSVARYAPRRETTPESTSSVRPASSSARNARTAASRPQTAAKIASVPPTRHALYPPTVSRSCGTP